MKTYLMTIPTDQVTKRELLFRLRRRSHGKRWQFGIEVGANSGYKHYQCRYETSNGDYETERRYWGDLQLELLEAGGWSEYECKDGNFYSYMDDELGKYRFGKLKELQLCILAHGKRQQDREISVIVDKLGGIGKTWLARSCWLNGTGAYIDGNGTASKIIADMYDCTELRQVSRVFIDLTRNSNPNGSDLWSSIEQIKNGYLKDSRYQLREKWIRPPNVFVFTNNEPKWDRLSADRWDKIFVRETKEGKILMWDRDKEGNARERTFNRNN